MSTPPAWPTGRPPTASTKRGMPRPIYREPSPARPGLVLLGAGAGALWMLLFGFLAHSAHAYVWWTIVAGVAAWVAVFILARLGDRGIAAGVAMISGLAVAIAFSVVMVHWIDGHWILW
jgi:hypothetical protein